VSLERGPLSLVRIIEELLEWKSSGSGLENRVLRPWGSVALTTQHHPQKLAPTSPTSGGRSVGIVRLRTKSHGVFIVNILLRFFLKTAGLTEEVH
jgi:hypothetical protein